jgi:hypothetical protein
MFEVSILPGTVNPVTFQAIGALPWFFGVGLKAGLGGSEALGWLAEEVADANFATMFIRLKTPSE